MADDKLAPLLKGPEQTDISITDGSRSACSLRVDLCHPSCRAREYCLLFSRRSVGQASPSGVGHSSAEHVVWEGTTWQGCPDVCFCCSPVCCSNCK